MSTPRVFGCLLTATFAVGLIIPHPVHSADSAAAVQCINPPSKDSNLTERFAPSAAGPNYFSADRLELIKDKIARFTGHVELRRGANRIRADEIVYDKPKDTVDAKGNIILDNRNGDRYQTDILHLQLESHKGYTGRSSFQTGGDIQARGDAKRIDFINKDVTKMKRLRFTTCPLGSSAWYLKIRELKLDKKKGFGTARRVTVRFFKVPIFYFPYLTFPITDKRLSGFLMPRIGRSNKLGTTLALPYYWNIAPQYDATLTPRFMSKRGTQLQTDFRYLGRRHSGQLRFEFLPNDNEAGDDRAAGSFKHSQTLSPLWSADIDLRGVSDKDYMNDFGDNLAISSQTHLPSTANISYRGSIWQFSTRLSSYQTIDKTLSPTQEAYDRLPQILLAASKISKGGRLRLGFDSEWVAFEHDVNLTGRRLNINPYISFPLRKSYGFLIPRISAKHIAYELDDSGNTKPDLTVGMVSLDSGLIFERNTRIGKRRLVQTLEPRLYYLYVPFKNQDQLPIFDSSLPDFNFSSLFRENRFIGGDRIGDANQVTLAITTRFLDADNSSEYFSFSLGQIYYFDDQRVNIPASTILRNTSDLVAEAQARLPGNWFVRSTLQWNRDTKETQKGTFYLQYHPSKDKIFNFSHRFLRNDDEQVDVSLQWPVVRSWTVMARSNYSLKDERNIGSYAGFQYKSCCWAIRVFADRRVDQNGVQNKSVMLELRLSGLTKFSKSPASPLVQSVFSFPKTVTTRMHGTE